ncbi:hypothetical protein HDZ31DRAFT_83492 [Schizophyllum fasciatum]
MSDAPAAPVTENGAPPVTEESKAPETPNFKVFVGNLAYSITDEGLKAFFAPFQSDILSVQVIQRGSRSAGYGFVALGTEETAQKAVEALNKKELDGREVIVELAKPAEEKEKEKKERKAKRRTGRRGSKAVPGEVSEAEANGEKAEGEPAAEGDASKPKKKKKKAKKAKAANGDAAEGAPAGEAAASGDAAAPKKEKAKKKKAPRPPRPAGEDPVGEPSKTMLFVANLGFNVDDAGLSALFTENNLHVVSARIVRRRWGKPRKSKGYGFVDVGSEEEQKKAIEVLQGKEVGGRAIAVKVAVNSPQSDSEGEGKPEGSRKQLEQEAREEGLSKSLFERAADEGRAPVENKALAMMMKMGFKPGQSLGVKEEEGEGEGKEGGKEEEGGAKEDTKDEPAAGEPSTSKASTSRHLINPIAINEWTGKTGIGVKRRPPSPTSGEMLAKMAKMADEKKDIDFRGRARQEYLERRAYGQLKGAQRTCFNLDEKDGKKVWMPISWRVHSFESRLIPLSAQYNVLWLDPEDRDTFPAGLVEALEQHTSFTMPLPRDPRRDDDIEGRLRRQIHADRLRPLNAEDEDAAKAAPLPEYEQATLEEACQFLRLPAADRLYLVLSYLRDRYSYCLFCGTQYEDEEDMANNCPGPSEEDHD